MIVPFIIFINYFTISAKYQKAHKEFLKAVAENDPDLFEEVSFFLFFFFSILLTIQALCEYQYHPDSLLQLSLLAKSQGQLQTSEDLLLRCLYGYQVLSLFYFSYYHSL